ncbi:MAG: hypothetical protein IKW43_00330 [Bacteroidaceae bacterium]|nr:hypothetical protein [Bacteroidaceae bacterium]
MKKHVSTDYLWLEYKVAKKAIEVMESIKEYVSKELYNKMYNSLPGLDAELQLVVAANLRDAVSYGWERYTSLSHVDKMLKSCYLAIDKDLGRI